MHPVCVACILFCRIIVEGVKAYRFHFGAFQFAITLTWEQVTLCTVDWRVRCAYYSFFKLLNLISLAYRLIAKSAHKQITRPRSIRNGLKSYTYTHCIVTWHAVEIGVLKTNRIRVIMGDWQKQNTKKRRTVQPNESIWMGRGDDRFKLQTTEESATEKALHRVERVPD